MTSAPQTERIDRTRAVVSALAGTTPERRVRALREALDAAAGRSDPAALLDAVDSLAGLLTRAETQLSGLERSVHDDLDRAGTLEHVRTSARLASAADVATAVATARSLLLDADEARAAGARHDPAAVLLLLLDADAALDGIVEGYREPAARADRQLLLIESARTAVLLDAETAALLAAVHGEAVTTAPRILVDETRAALAEALRSAPGDPVAALAALRSLAARARSALDETLVDLDGPAAVPEPRDTVPAA